MQRLILLAAVVVASSVGAHAGELDSAETRILSVQLAVVTSSPALEARLHEVSAGGAEAKAEAAAISPYLEWQSEGLGGDRTPNAQDSLRVGTEINFFGQMGPARELTRVADEGQEVGRNAAVRSVATEAVRRWIRLAAAEEQLRVRRVRLERIDTALALLEARHQLGEVAGTEVSRLDLEYTDVALRVAETEVEVERLQLAVAELCGPGFPRPRPGDLAALVAASRTPRPDEVHPQSVALGVPMQSAKVQADMEQARARMAAATAWGRPTIEAEWEHFPDLGPAPGYDAWGFRFAVPLPLGSSGSRQRAAARERQALAAASREQREREALSLALSTSAEAQGAESRLETAAPAVGGLPRFEDSLSAQFRLGAISYLEYVYGLVRHDELMLSVIEANTDLLLARLRLSFLLDDPTIFPTAVFATEEDS